MFESPFPSPPVLVTFKVFPVPRSIVMDSYQGEWMRKVVCPVMG